ncbi:hypothetical protein [Streptomyces sp. NPDC047043]|uniref:hypothetical protein n=1 Tax=Streptomyces sp. NPDC047043 TaxID=3154497 RepID=UPI0034090C9D
MPVLIVLTSSESTAQWAAQPINVGPAGWETCTVRPLVIGPDSEPFIADERLSGGDAFLEALSAIVHGAGPGSGPFADGAP